MRRTLRLTSHVVERLLALERMCRRTPGPQGRLKETASVEAVVLALVRLRSSQTVSTKSRSVDGRWVSDELARQAPKEVLEPRDAELLIYETLDGAHSV